MFLFSHITVVDVADDNIIVRRRTDDGDDGDGDGVFRISETILVVIVFHSMVTMSNITHFVDKTI